MQNNNYLSRDKTQAMIDSLGVKKENGPAFLEGLAKKGYIIEGYNDQPTQNEPTLGQELKQRGANIINAAKQAYNENASIASDPNVGPVGKVIGETASAAQLPLRVLGQAGGAVGDVIGAVASPVISGAMNAVKSVLPQNQTQQSEGPTQPSLLDKAITSWKTFEQNNPEIAQSLTDVANLFNLSGAEGAGKAIATKVTEKAIPATINATKQAIGTVAPAVKGTIQATKDIGSGVKTLGQSGADIIANTPGRIATNVATKKATQLEIQSLPIEQARKAVTEGVDLTDAKNLLNKVTGDAQTTKLINSIQRTAAGEATIEPISVIGEPIVKTLKVAKNKVDKIGAKLGEVSKNIGDLNSIDLQNNILRSLKSVKGLNGLKVADNGALDFTGTVLSDMSSQAQKYINKAYQQAINSTTGDKAHLLRQELFEILGGKKKALVNMTGTEENAINAIRQGLSDTIDIVSPEYKTLNKQYATMIQPIQDLQKVLKGATGEDVNILNETAGLLARRLTSTAISRPQIQKIFNAIDKVAGTKSLEKVTNLQDIYNILNKYYDIAPKTGFQALSRTATEQGINPVGKVMEAVKGFAGTTEATRTKALDELLNSILKGEHK